MDKLLLLISDARLRQLYHELLTSENFEIVAASTVENALVLQTLENISILIIYPDDTDSKMINTLLHLEKTVKQFSKTRIIVLTADTEQYASLLSPTDVTINTMHLNPDEIVKKIKQVLLSKKR